MPNLILTCNAGSSSIKFALFEKEKLHQLFHGEIEDVNGTPTFWVKDARDQKIEHKNGLNPGYHSAILALLEWINSCSDEMHIVAVGHRVVHGGKAFVEPVIITDAIIKKLEELSPLAPLHQPHNIAVMKIFAELHPNIPQLACFDTSFHRAQPLTTQLFALPLNYANDGVIRYGFHGISYEYIASILPEYADKMAESRVIVAHLGNGASMCAMKERKSVATTMGFTALDGLMMGTRCGNIDPGVVLYLMEEKGMSIKEVTDLLYKQSGLKGVSGISHDMRDLLRSDAKSASTAVDLFCYQAAKELCALLPSLGGIDAIVFTAGIGENSAIIRKNICDRLIWLGLQLDDSANTSNATAIHSLASRVSVYIIPTNEERMISMHVDAKLLTHSISSE